MGHSEGHPEIEIFGFHYPDQAFYLIAWLPGLQTGRGEPKSVISDTEVRGDLILHEMASYQLAFKQNKHLSFLLAFILALSKVRGLSLMQQFEGDGGTVCCCSEGAAGEGIGGGGIDVSQC